MGVHQPKATKTIREQTTMVTELHVNLKVIIANMHILWRIGVKKILEASTYIITRTDRNI